jgi:hypothetical protein
MNKIVTVEQLSEGIKKNFVIIPHPERKFLVNQYRNGNRNMAIICFIGIADRLNISSYNVCDFLRLDQEVHSEYLYLFDRYMTNAKNGAEIDYRVNSDVRENCPSIALRKARLVKNFLSNYYRVEIEL